MSTETGYCNFPLCKRIAEKNGYCIGHKIYSDAPVEKKHPKPIAKQSEKKKEQLKDEKENRDEKEKWFADTRKKLVGTCQCGCGEPSSKKDDLHFRSSCCHIFPKAIFHSVMFHPLNFVERAFWGGCHSNMDNQSLDKWPNMADWEDIKAKVKILKPLLTEAEKRHKFYKQLISLIAADDKSICLATHDKELNAVIVEPIK